MKRTIPYNHMIEELDSTIAQAIDTLEENRDIADNLDVMTEEEVYQVEELLEQLEAIRGVIYD